MTLNTPKGRQPALARRLREGHSLIATELAEEFGTSLGTVRRDIQAVELAGHAHRLRGGAVPIQSAAKPVSERIGTANPKLVTATLACLNDRFTIVLNGGSAPVAIAEQLSPKPDRRVSPLSPWGAMACRQNGVLAYMPGGRLSTLGGVNIGAKVGAVPPKTAPFRARDLEVTHV